MSLHILPVTNPQEAAPLAKLIKATWNDVNADSARIARVISLGGRKTYLAKTDSGAVGFVDGFTTTDVDGHTRLELDLLAVLPTAQQQGLGRALVARFLGDTEVNQVRAVVRQDNTAAAGLFAKYGFEAISDDVLMIYNGESSADSLLVRLGVRVETLTYSGVWVEPVGVEMLRACCEQSRRDEVIGALVPYARQDLRDAAYQLGYVVVDRYAQWVLNRSLGKRGS